MKNFEGIEFFKPSEFTHPEKMDRELLQRLDAFRRYINEGVVITSSTGGTHAENSQHYLGKAVDIVVPTFRGSLLSLFFVAERFGFRGIGVYPKWHYDRKIIGGLHLDVRNTGESFQGARWIGILNKDTGKNEYLPLNPKNLIEQGILTEPK